MTELSDEVDAEMLTSATLARELAALRASVGAAEGSEETQLQASAATLREELQSLSDATQLTRTELQRLRQVEARC